MATKSYKSFITASLLGKVPTEANEELAVKKLNEHDCVIERIHMPVKNSIIGRKEVITKTDSNLF